MKNLDKIKGSPGDHLANERTFLAWIRTSIGIMGFGFVVVKFSLFVRQISIALGAPVKVPHAEYSHAIGVALVALGGLTIIFSYINYQNTKKQLDTGLFIPSNKLLGFIALILIIISLALLSYLTETK